MVGNGDDSERPRDTKNCVLAVETIALRENEHALPLARRSERGGNLPGHAARKHELRRAHDQRSAISGNAPGILARTRKAHDALVIRSVDAHLISMAKDGGSRLVGVMAASTANTRGRKLDVGGAVT